MMCRTITAQIIIFTAKNTNSLSTKLRTDRQHPHRHDESIKNCTWSDGTIKIMLKYVFRLQNIEGVNR